MNFARDPSNPHAYLECLFFGMALFCPDRAASLAEDGILVLSWPPTACIPCNIYLMDRHLENKRTVTETMLYYRSFLPYSNRLGERQSRHFMFLQRNDQRLPAPLP